ncbi:MAG: sigma-54-dependent transcriptional regulator [Nitrospiria bacterium]
MTKQRGTVLVVDDDPEMCELLVELLTEESYNTESVQSGEAAIQILEEKTVDLVISDLKMHGLSGLDLLKRARSIRPDQAVIIITAFGTVETAIEAMKRGAVDYIIKPFKREHLLLVAEKAFERVRLQQEVRRLRQEISDTYQYANIIGKSKAMQNIFRLIQRVSESTINIAITGESGTGKEVVAKALHYNSPRKDRPFIAVDCASIPEMLLESELFGHVRGAFTDAKVDKKGMFEVAQGGTLFLDEIGEMPISLQPKLLRVIQEKMVRRVGSTQTLSVDIRIISATNRNLLELVNKKAFRDDLYYRLNVLQIDLPPLRKRREDIPLLAGHFLKKYAAAQKKDVTAFSEAAMKLLIEYAWPGNVRELENVIERGVTLAQTETLSATDLPPIMTRQRGDQWVLDQTLAKMAPLESLEEAYVWEVLQRLEGNKSQAAQVLKIDRKTLYKKIRHYQKKDSA